MTGKELEDALEALIDATTLQNVIVGLEEICIGKAAHLDENWQDNDAAKLWDRAARTLGKVWRNKNIGAVS